MKEYLVEKFIKPRTKRLRNPTAFSSFSSGSVKKIGPFENRGSHTYCPYPKEMVSVMRLRRYMVTVRYPGNTLLNYASIGDCKSRTNLPVARLLMEAVFYEMELSETVIVRWADYQFFFTRVR